MFKLMRLYVLNMCSFCISIIPQYSCKKNNNNKVKIIIPPLQGKKKKKEWQNNSIKGAGVPDNIQHRISRGLLTLGLLCEGYIYILGYYYLFPV